MFSKAVNSILLSTMIFIAVIYDCKSSAPLMTIIPKSDLRSGYLPDSYELANIQISSKSDECRLSVWDELAKNETIPGSYQLEGRSKGNDIIKLRLVGDGWIPNTISGKGLLQVTSNNDSHLRLLSNGDQFIRNNMWMLNITVSCLSIKH